MRRFKVRDILVSPMAGGLLAGDGPCQTDPPTGPCAKGMEYVTDRPHYNEDDDHKTKPCREGDDTKKPCAVNGDTKHYCVEDGNTFLPCLTPTKEGPECFTDQKGPGKKDPNYTKYICKAKSDTKIPCKGGTVDTKIEGVPEHPWWGHMGNTKPCADDGVTTYECKFDNTAFACKNKKDDQENTIYRCRLGSATQDICERANTKPCEGDAHTEYHAHGTFCYNTYPKCPKANVTNLALADALGCPPLSPLALPADDPTALDALAILHAELRDALVRVEVRQGEIESGLEPQTVQDAAAIEATLEGALIAARATTNRLRDARALVATAKKRPSGRGKKSPRRR